MSKSKKGIELPISMVIVLILTIIVFAFGTTILFKSYRWATETTKEIDAATEREIERVLLEGNNIVALPKNAAKARIGEQVAFGLGIRNILETGQFAVTTSFAGAYTPTDAVLNANAAVVESEWLGNFKQQGGINIEKDQIYTVPIRILAGDHTDTNLPTQKGTYVFNVCVFEEAKAQPVCRPNLETYGGQIHQVTIIV